MFVKEADTSANTMTWRRKWEESPILARITKFQHDIDVSRYAVHLNSFSSSTRFGSGTFMPNDGIERRPQTARREQTLAFATPLAPARRKPRFVGGVRSNDLVLAGFGRA